MEASEGRRRARGTVGEQYFMGRLALEGTRDPYRGQVRRDGSRHPGLQKRKRPGMAECATVSRTGMLVGMLVREGLRLRHYYGTEEQE